MEIVFQETMLENIHLKDNLRKMGSEVTQLMNIKKQVEKAHNALDDEHESLKEMYQELKDEKEISDLGKQDALKLLNTTEEELSKLKKGV